MNVCRVGADSLFATTSHDQLDVDTLMDISSLNFDSCPNGTPAASSYSDLNVDLIQLT